MLKFAQFLPGMEYGMKKSYALVLLVLLVSATVALSSEPPAFAVLPQFGVLPQFQQPVERPKYDPKGATVHVGRPATGRPGVWEWGSGTCIWCEGGKSVVLTCNHVFADQPGPGTPFFEAPCPCNGIVREANQAKNFPCVCMAADKDADIALVIVDGVLPVAEIAENDAKPGSVVRHYGYGSGGGTGKVVALGDRGNQPKDWFHSTAASDSGDSGAGVFDENGCLVAVHCGKDPSRQFSRGAPVSSVKVSVRNKYRGPFSRFRERMGITVSVTETPAATTGKTPDAGPVPKTIDTPKSEARSPGGLRYATIQTGPYDGGVELFVDPATGVVWRFARPGESVGSSTSGGCANGRCPLQQAPARTR